MTLNNAISVASDHQNIYSCFPVLSAADISLQFQHSFSAHWGLELRKSMQFERFEEQMCNVLHVACAEDDQ